MKPMAPPALSVGKVAQFVHGQWRGHRDRRCPLARAASRPRLWRGGRTWLLTAISSRGSPRRKSRTGVRGPSGARSEEHTSELQSLMRISYAVFCLKKKKTEETTNNSKEK